MRNWKLSKEITRWLRKTEKEELARQLAFEFVIPLADETKRILAPQNSPKSQRDFRD